MDTNDQPSTITYDSPHPIYATSFSHTHPHLLTVGSFLEDFTNKITILTLSNNSLTPINTIPHPYPPTKLLFSPPSLHSLSSPPLLASSSDSLRLFTLPSPNSNTTPALTSTLNNAKHSDYSSPLTSFDWNDVVPSRIGTSSIDTTCTIWDIERSIVETQLIAHDKEVYDIAWGEAGVFASVSGDGSLRMFDLRDKEHSTIVYETSGEVPLLRLVWNKSDLRYIAAVAMDSGKVIVLDIRAPAVPVAELGREGGGSVNAVAWGPRNGRWLCSGGDDGLALLWDVGGEGERERGVEPVSVYSASEEINQVQWSSAQPDWVAVAFGSKLQLLRV